MIDLQTIAAQSPLTVEQLEAIEHFMDAPNLLSPEAVRKQLHWFAVELQLATYYFRSTPLEEIAQHALALAASRIVQTHSDGGLGIQLISEQAETAVYIVEDVSRRTIEIEERIESRYPTFRLESYQTAPIRGDLRLRLYLAGRPTFDPDRTQKGFQAHATQQFLQRSSQEAKDRYQALWTSVRKDVAPRVHVSHKEDSGETRLMLGVRGSRPLATLSAFSHLFHRAGVAIARKYVEPFADDVEIMTFYFNDEQVDIAGLERELIAAVLLPSGGVSSLFSDELLSAQQTLYATAAAAFAHQFVSEFDDYAVVRAAVAHDLEAKGVLDSMRLNLTKNTFSTARIAVTSARYHHIVRLLFDHFAALHVGAGDAAQIKAQLERALSRDVSYHRDRTILGFFLAFNELIEQTNFFSRTRATVTFQLRTAFLNREEFDAAPFGLVFLVGREFVGFHVRFRDIARGGIRIVRSRTADAYARNVDTIFLENYGLAATQQSKNKDIPEGGSKGIVLINEGLADSDAAAANAFKSYVDGLLDLMIGPREQPHDEPKAVLFLGPDEGSAGLMDWAATHARSRGYSLWKSFSTGKGLELGGVPHDRYGMTTLSVHTYATATLEKLGLAEERIFKIQTGGPDGDLGSNEILISRDNTKAIVDGSGVVYDPAGLDREELTRLARARVPVAEYDKTLLSDQGFFVGVTERDVRLPDGTEVPNGEDFRNRFHVSPYMQADLFVPCGGRPSAINLANWRNLLDDSGKPRVKVIVEGANLFITQEARLRLEEHGVIVFKDASTNKGGVTSSSLEVYASLAMTDAEYQEHMVVEGGLVPDFRSALVDQIRARIVHNATREFELLWEEWQRGAGALSNLSDRVSRHINRLADAIAGSDLVDRTVVRETVLRRYTPPVLLNLVGVAGIVDRVPRAYLNALIASQIAADYVYSTGLSATEVEFANFVAQIVS